MKGQSTTMNRLYHAPLAASPVVGHHDILRRVALPGRPDFLGRLLEVLVGDYRLSQMLLRVFGLRILGDVCLKDYGDCRVDERGQVRSVESPGHFNELPDLHLL